jgi:hypothetical protein
MKYTVYNPDSGEILYTLIGSDLDSVEFNLQGKSWLEGDYSAADYYIDQAQAVAKLSKPGEFYQWNQEQKQWHFDAEYAASNARHQRQQCLSLVDQVNPMWYASLSAEQQQQLCTYRQALLDVPQQADFPVQVNWPAKPTWL